jgi:carboxypeptidase family protein/Big-like domain-containing protein
LYLIATLACLAIATGWVAGCENQKTPTAPTAPTVSAGPSLTALTVKGNATLTAPGQTTQLTLEATLSDGSKKDVTSTAQWSTTNSSVVVVSPTGLASASGFGRASVIGSAAGRGSPSFVMTVLPEGTYILSGRVTEAGDLPLAGVRVETIGGPMSGRVAMTSGFSGDYAFNGVSGVLQIRATKDGYQPATQNVSQDTEHVNVELAPTVPYASLGGVYSLTFTASPSCTLPDDAVTRTYTATIDQRGAPLTIFLSDARFLTSGQVTSNQFFGRVLGNVVSFTLLTYYCPDYVGCVTEKLADTRYLSLTGTAKAVATVSGMSAVFAGAVSVTNSPDGRESQPIAACSASDHHLIFTRNAGTSSKRSTVRSAIR